MRNRAGRTARTRGRSVAARAPPRSQPKLPTHSGSREQESPDLEAYTDAIRILALYCEVHGKPLLARQLRREHIQNFIADQDRLAGDDLLPGTAWHGSDALGGARAFCTSHRL